MYLQIVMQCIENDSQELLTVLFITNIEPSPILGYNILEMKMVLSMLAGNYV